CARSISSTMRSWPAQTPRWRRASRTPPRSSARRAPATTGRRSRPRVQTRPPNSADGGQPIMGDAYGVVKVAAVQAASVFLDREGSTEKACRLIREAGRDGARVIGFPEGFIPAHPVWYHHHAATGALSNRLATELFKNAVEIPGPETAALSEAARDANAYVVMGVCEKMPNTLGTMFNTQIYFGPDGALIGKHQKIMPTVGERLVHTGGYGDTFGAFQTEFGPMSGLICGENSNPLAVFALTAEGTRIHVMSWPNHFPVSGDPLRDRVAIDARSFAQMSKAFVIAACGTVDERMVEMLKGDADTEKFLRDPDSCGGSCIVAPNSRVIAGPMGAEEGILYADCNLEIGIQMKLRHDFAGHYNRPDIFHLQINRSAPKLYSVHGTNAIGETSPTKLIEPTSALLAAPTTDNDDGHRNTSEASRSPHHLRNRTWGTALRHQWRGAHRFRGGHALDHIVGRLGPRLVGARGRARGDWPRGARQQEVPECRRASPARRRLLSFRQVPVRAGPRPDEGRPHEGGRMPQAGGALSAPAGRARGDAL